MIKKMLLMFMVMGALTLMVGCDMGSSNTFTFIIDESYDEYITMGTSADYAPYEWLVKDENNNQTVVGIDIEIAKVIAKHAGKNLKVIHKGFDFLLEDLADGRVDFVISAMTPTPERAEIVDFSTVYYMATQVVLIETKNMDVYTSVASMNLSNIRIGAQLGSIQQDYANDLFDAPQKQFIQAVPDLVLGLTSGQLAGVIMEKPVAEGYINNITGLSIANFTLGNPEDGSAVAVRKGNKALLELINDTIQILQESGQIEQFVKDSVLLNS
ncbi:ABC transporter substrate-binding protein [Acholeplasma laidlawii]|uniref:ABC transporter substrate-binding protein n=1 Tax=Acholeplasma laidlawii TaxID=2148 RepID=UPI0021F6DB78|nr:ABC transporter substrate-binding protein [Acholeplasma laidlawii]